MVALVARAPREYLGEDEIVDASNPAIAWLAARLWRDAVGGHVRFARLAFEFVRDEIAHSVDVGDRRVVVTASETLRQGVGVCFSKAHLLTALLRSVSIPAGLCYQRLSDGRGRYVVHGLVAVYLGGGWHREDARGNKRGVSAEFSLGPERLAWSVRPELGELDYPQVFARPHPAILAALRSGEDILELCASGLPEALPAAAA